MATIAFYTYATLVTPGHNDIEVMLDVICQVIPDTTRISVHAQTINITDITTREVTHITMLDPNVADGANVLRTIIYEPGEPVNVLN